MISRDDFDQWRTSPITLEIFQMLYERKMRIANQLASGACLDSPEEHGVAVGRYREITDLEEMTYTELMGIAEVVDHEGNTSKTRSDD